MDNAICVLKDMEENDMKYDKFTAKADIYDKYRPKYSKDFIDYLYQYLALPTNAVIADIGAGTGILSEEFLKRGSNVICVEPNKKILEQAKGKLQHYKNVSFINETAESTNIKDMSIDVVTVGQAFHWFDEKKFLKECKRILVDKGTVVLAWNVSNSEDPINREISHLNYIYAENYNGYNARDKESNIEYSYFFKDGKMEIHFFENNLLLDKEEFIGRCLSRSYAPNPGDVNYDKYVNCLSDMFNNYSENKKIKIKNKTKCILGRVK